jgi:hypothetical protein
VEYLVDACARVFPRGGSIGSGRADRDRQGLRRRAMRIRLHYVDTTVEEGHTSEGGAITVRMRGCHLQASVTPFFFINWHPAIHKLFALRTEFDTEASLESFSAGTGKSPEHFAACASTLSNMGTLSLIVPASIYLPQFCSLVPCTEMW